jgi:hypothetical protein
MKTKTSKNLKRKPLGGEIFRIVIKESDDQEYYYVGSVFKEDSIIVPKDLYPIGLCIPFSRKRWEEFDDLQTARHVLEALEVLADASGVVIQIDIEECPAKV